MKVTFVTQRQLYMSEFGAGLESYGLREIIKNPTICSKIFVQSLFDLKVDANFLYSILQPIYSEAGSSRCQVEDVVMDNFQDMLLQLEDVGIAGKEVPLAWMDVEQEHGIDATSSYAFQTQDMSIPKILGWPTLPLLHMRTNDTLVKQCAPVCCGQFERSQSFVAENPCMKHV